MTDDLLRSGTVAHSRARWTIYLLYACLAVDVIAIGSGLAQRSLLSRVAAGEQLSNEAAEANDGRQSAIGSLQVLALVVTGIVWLRWLHRAYSNLALVGTKKSQYTPGWAVGYWFIPFINLVRPYQIVVELWLRSEHANVAESIKDLPRPSIVSWWWGAYLVSGFSGRAFATLARNATSIDELLQVTNLGVGVDVIGVVSALLAIAVVRGVDQRQQQFQAPADTATIP